MPFKTWWDVLKSIFASEFSAQIQCFFADSFLLKATKSAHFQITFASDSLYFCFVFSWFCFVICFYFIKKVHTHTLSPVVFFRPIFQRIFLYSFCTFRKGMKCKKLCQGIIVSPGMTIGFFNCKMYDLFFLMPFCTMKPIFDLFEIVFRKAEKFVETLRAAVLSAGALTI